MLSDGALVTSHLFDLTSLTPSTTYFFIISSTDGDGSTATSLEKTFDTKEAEEPEDETPPVISSVNTVTTTSTATIAWNTDELSSSEVDYATSSENLVSSPLGVSDLTEVTDHSIELINLTASTTYYFIVKSEDSSGNIASTTEDTFDIE